MGKNIAPTINHFNEKLLLLKHQLNTNTAIEIAEKRHNFMEVFFRAILSRTRRKA